MSPYRKRLMGSKEVAEYLGIQTSNIDAQAGMPKPFEELSCGRIWRTEDIRLFAEARRRRRSR